MKRIFGRWIISDWKSMSIQDRLTFKRLCMVPLFAYLVFAFLHRVSLTLFILLFAFLLYNYFQRNKKWRRQPFREGDFVHTFKISFCIFLLLAAHFAWDITCLRCKVMMSTFSRLSRSEIIHGRAAMGLLATLLLVKSLIWAS